MSELERIARELQEAIEKITGDRSSEKREVDDFFRRSSPSNPKLTYRFRRGRSVLPNDYPFMALALFGESGVWKGKDNNNKNLLDLPDNTDISLAGIVNLGKKKFIADWIDYGTDRIYRHENGELLNFPLDYNFPPVYYGGGFHGWLATLDRWIAPPAFTTSVTTVGADTRNYTRAIVESGENHQRNYSAISSYSGSLSPAVFQGINGEVDSYSIASSGSSSVVVSDSLESEYRGARMRSGIVGGEETIEIFTRETRSLSLSETATADQTYTHAFGFQGGWYNGNYGTPDSFSMAYSLNYLDDRLTETDSGEVTIEVADGVTAIVRYLDRVSVSETESVGSPGSMSVATATGTFDWSESLVENREYKDFRITEYFRGIDGLAFYNSFERESTSQLERNSTGTYKVQFAGYFPREFSFGITPTSAQAWLPPIGNNFFGGGIFPGEPYTVHSIGVAGGYSGTYFSTTSIRDSIIQSRPLEKKNAHIATQLGTILRPGFLNSLQAISSQWPRGNEFGTIEGIYFADNGQSVRLNTDNSFFWRITNAGNLEIPNLPATISIAPFRIDLDLKRYSIGLNAGICPGTGGLLNVDGSTSVPIRFPIERVETITYTPTNENTSTVTRSAIVSEHSPVDPAWGSMNGSAIAFVRWENEKLYLYEGTLSISFTDAWVPQTINQVVIAEYVRRRSIASCSLQLQTKRPIKYFCHSSIDPNTTGWVFSRDNCLGLIRTYLARENQRASLYRNKGKVYFAFAEPIDAGDIRKKGELWVDRYRFADGNFLRDREERGAVSGLTAIGESIGSIPISYFP